VSGRRREPKALEWPRGSGRIAIYSPEEQLYVLGIADHESVHREMRNRQLAHLHDLKVEFQVDLILDDVGEDEPE
jgi:hypothetical protein